jgi:hypothetical protein
MGASFYPPPPPPKKISVRGWVDPRAIVRAVWRIRSVKKSNNLIGNWTRNPPLALLIYQYSDVSIITSLMHSAFSIVMSDSLQVRSFVWQGVHDPTLHCGLWNFVFISLFYMKHAQRSIHLPSKGRFSLYHTSSQDGCLVEGGYLPHSVVCVVKAPFCPLVLGPWPTQSVKCWCDNFQSQDYRFEWSKTAMTNWRPAGRIWPTAWFTPAPAKSLVYFLWGSSDRRQ